MANTNPHQGHRKRVRERIISEGLDGFQPHEILEFLLFHTVPQKDTNLMAHKLIDAFGSLQNVLEATPKELMSKGKVSENTAVFLASLTQVFSYYEKNKEEKSPINSPEKMVKMFKPYFIGQTKERLVVAFLDSGLRLKNIVEFGTGQENGFRFNSKDILREALTGDAYNVAIAHNHPVSVCSPSKNDINTTSELKNQLEHFEMKLIDHIIFGTNGTFSFANDEQFDCFVSGGNK